MFTSALCILAISALLQAQEPPASLQDARIDVPVAGATMPMLDVGGRPMIDVRINGKGPFPFILDTGATFSAVDGSLMAELSLPAGPTIGGGSTVRIDEFRVGDAVVHGFVAGSLGSMLGGFTGPNRPRGVLSAAAFPGELVVLDYPRRQVTIAHGALPSADDTHIFEYRAAEALPVVPVTVAGHQYRIHLDSGSPAGIMLPTKYAHELPLAAPPVVIGQARTVAGTFPVSVATVNGTIGIGGYTVDMKDVRFSDLRPGSQPGVGNVGGQVLKDFVITFDSKNRRIRFERPESSNPAGAPVTANRMAPDGPAQPRVTVPDGGASVPMRIDGGRLIIDVKVNGQGPFPFQLDTGAAGDARADTSLVTALKLETVGEARGAAAGGKLVTMPIVRFDTLDIGAIHITGVDAPSRDYERPGTASISGVLALSLLRDDLVTLDFEHGTLQVVKGTLTEPDDGEILTLDLSRRIPAIAIRVGDQSVIADLDTGSTAGIMLPSSLSSHVSLASPLKTVARAATVSGPMDMSAAPLDGNVTIGRYTIANPTLEFAPGTERGVLGLPVLRQFLVQFDLHSGRVRLMRTTTAPIAISPLPH